MVNLGRRVIRDSLRPFVQDDIWRLTLFDLNALYGPRLNQRDLALLRQPPYSIRTVGDVLMQPLATYKAIAGFGAARRNALRKLINEIGFEMDYRRAVNAEPLNRSAAPAELHMLRSTVYMRKLSKIDELPLRLVNALASEGIHHLGHALNATRAQLLQIETLGDDSVTSFERYLDSLELRDAWHSQALIVRAA